MTKQEATQEACSIIALAYHSIGDYKQPCDCFCGKDDKRTGGFQIADKATFDYVREAVKEKLIKDGFTVRDWYQKTLKETYRMNTMQEIKDAVLAGKKAFWANDNYEIIVDNIGQWLIHSIFNHHYVGLTEAYLKDCYIKD